MTVELTTLANGLRVVSHWMPHLQTVSLGIWVGAGARHESLREHGISHLLEHMAFKGTARRTARRIAEEIEQVGGELNAATGMESTAYYARVLKGDEGIALDIIADILRNPSFAESELEREREVILQEIASIKDSPDELAYDLLHDAAFPEQPAGRPIIGTPDSVAAITTADLRAFLEARYLAPRTIVSAAGAIDHGNLVRLSEALLGGMSADQPEEPAPAHYQGGRRSTAKSFEQSHVLVGFSSPSYRDPDFFAAQVFSCLLGGGMSSRLFQSVRESRGLCYSIYASAWGLADAGMMSIHAATGVDRLKPLTEVLREELVMAATDRPSDSEVERAKAQIKAGLLMSLESTSARAEQLARQLLVADRVIPVEELIGRVDDVSPDHMRKVAARILQEARPSIVVVGAGRKSAACAAAAERSLIG